MGPSDPSPTPIRQFQLEIARDLRAYMRQSSAEFQDSLQGLSASFAGHSRKLRLAGEGLSKDDSRMGLALPPTAVPKSVAAESENEAGNHLRW